MSRVRFESLCRGLSPVEQEELATCVDLYPDDIYEPPWLIDQDRIGAEFERLRAEQQARAAAATSWAWAGWLWSWPRNNGKTALARSLPPEWKPAGHGVWVAPAGTAPPWLSGGDLAYEEFLEPAEWARRHFLNDVVVAKPTPDELDAAETVHQMMALYARLKPGIVRQLRAGPRAMDAIARRFSQAEAAPGDASVVEPIGELGGISVVVDPDLAVNAWQLVDPVTGKVLFEGVIGSTVDDYVEAVRDCIDDLAERSGLPPKFFM